MTALLTRYKAYVDLALLAILTGLAATGFLLSALGGFREAALAVILITLGFVWRLGRDLRAYPSAFLVAALVAQTASDWLWGLIALGLIVLVVLESEVRRQVRRRSGISSQAYDLPGYTARRLTLKSLTFDVSCGLILGLWIVVALGLPTWSLVVVTLIGVVGAGAITAHDWVKWPRPVHEAHLRSALEAYQPKFLLHFSAPAGSTYQPAMWMSYLERIGVPFVVVLREAHSVAEMRAMTSAPVIVASSISSLDNAMVDSVSAIMYVNNGMKNTHAVRFSDVTHVQLLHGDSDKPPSYSR
ncbi:MAG: hypothetical protein IPL43_13145 [Micropruina sp.]|nr:hypothetical protein [Micropruina sp.]